MSGGEKDEEEEETEGPGGGEGEGASERARPRGVRCVPAFELTRGPSPALRVLGALFPAFPGDLLSSYLESSRAGDGEWQFDAGFAGWRPTPPASPRTVMLTAASSGDHPSSGATSTLPVRSSSSLLPLK